jgi:hypothetical protein
MSTYKMIDSRGVKFQVGHRERLQMLRAMWKASDRPSIGRTAWFVLVVRQMLRLVVHFAYRVVQIVHLPKDKCGYKNR